MELGVLRRLIKKTDSKPRERQCILVIAGYAPSLINFRGPLLRAFVSAGLEVNCTAPEEDAETAAQLQEIRARYAPLPVERNRIGIGGDLRYALRVWRLCRRLRPDYVLAYTAKPVVFGCSAAALARVPRIYALVTGLGYVFAGETRRHRLMQSIMRRLYRFAFARCRRVFLQNPDDRDYFVQRRVLDPAKAVVVNGSGVDIGYFRPVALPKGDEIVFLLIARLIGDKGIREYARAAERLRRRYPQARFQLLGPGDPSPNAISREEVRAWAGAGVIEYLGETKDVRPFLAAASVYVLPSYYGEGTPRTVLEAMAMGRPVITTDAPGCRQTVEQNRNGYLVPVRDADALARAMQRFIEKPSQITKMGKQSRIMAETIFDARKVNEQMLEAMGV